MNRFKVLLCAMLLVFGVSTVAGATIYENYTGYQFVGEGNSFSYYFDLALENYGSTNSNLIQENDVAIGLGIPLQSAYIQIGVYSVDFAWENTNVELTAYYDDTQYTLFNGWFNLNRINGPYATGIFELNGAALDSFGADPWGDITISANITPSWNYNDFAITEVGIGGSIAPVPEPATMLLLGVGLIGIAGLGRRKLIKK